MQRLLRNLYWLWACIFLLPLTACQVKEDQAYAAVADDNVAAVATVHPLATAAALRVYEQGGNAIDAAVAAALTLGVVDSHNSGLGGGNFALVHWADGRIEALDGREMAPQAATRDMYIKNGEPQPDWSKTGALAIGVPGALAVYDYMLKAGGKHQLPELIEPAARLAEQGVPVSAVMAKRLQRSAEKLKNFSGSRSIFLDKDAEALKQGDTLLQTDLAKTYRNIAKQGIGYFYGGDFAKQLAVWMEANGGIVTADDFGNYQMKKREPVSSDYRGYQVVGFPPPSSGGIHVAQILNILRPFDLAAMDEVDRYHVMAEAMKLAFADRAEFLGDTDFVNVPQGLIDASYAEILAKKINVEEAAKGVQHGQPPRADVDFFGKHTTHIATADRWGNWVAITTTVNTSFGSKVVIPGTGVVMNNQMDDFTIQPGTPNAFGLVGNEANSVAAGKRPLSSMSPTLVLKEGKPVMTLGAAGGPTIITQVVQALVNVIDLNLSVEDSLAAQRVHHQWKPDMLLVETNMPEALAKGLEQKGHKLYPRGHFGATQMIRLKGERFEAVTEPRVTKDVSAIAP
jgi:gamma-glutamyltranspeptidase/glutathione hydrolase